MEGSVYVMIQRCNCSMNRNTCDSFSLAFSLKSYQEQSNVNRDFGKSCISMSVNLEKIFETHVDLIEVERPKTGILETGWFLVREKWEDEDRLQKSST